MKPGAAVSIIVVILVCLLYSACADVYSTQAGKGTAIAAMDFTGEARWLYRVFACGSRDHSPGNAAITGDYCASLKEKTAEYHKKYLSVAKPFFSGLVPPGSPGTVVYPFGGNDLFAALAVHPPAGEIYTISLEYAGDPTVIPGAKDTVIVREISRFQAILFNILRYYDSSNEDILALSRDGVPGQITLALAAASINGYEPASMRFFEFTPEGDIRYYGNDDHRKLRSTPARRLSPYSVDASHSAFFRNVEIGFRGRGGGSRAFLFRHVAWNLDNGHFTDSPLHRHLVKKGRVIVIFKGANYMPWFNSFSALRRYVLDHAAVIVSDATGILPRHAAGAGFRPVTYGRFQAAFLKDGGGTNAVEMRDLWASQPYRPIPFRFGHADSRGAHHLVVWYGTGTK